MTLVFALSCTHRSYRSVFRFMYNDTRVLIYQSSDTRQLRVPPWHPTRPSPGTPRPTSVRAMETTRPWMTNLRTVRADGDDATRDARCTHIIRPNPQISIRFAQMSDSTSLRLPRPDETRRDSPTHIHLTARARRNKSRATAPQGPRHHLPLALTRSQRESVTSPCPITAPRLRASRTSPPTFNQCLSL